MGTGYVRNDTGNNIADGNVINASDLDGEFDALEDAFDSSTGHSHDGTTGEGPQIDTAGLADDAVTGAKIDSTTTVTAASFVGPLTGNADTATALETARTIAGQSFDGTGNISIAPGDLTGVTASAAELNLLDGVTATTAELNYVDGVTSSIQDQIDNINIDLLNDTTPQLGGSLDLNSNDVTGTGDINITGSVTATSFSGDGSSLTNIPSGTVSLTASGSLANGDTVVVNSDGTVSVVDGINQEIGSSTVFESGSTSSVSATFDSSNNKVVIAYRDNDNSGYGTAIVGTVSGTGITFGSPTVFESASTSYISPTFDSSNNKVVIAYRDIDNSNYGTAIVGTVSGTSISFGSPTVFESEITTWTSTTFDSNENKVVVAYLAQADGSARVGTVNGTAISFGSKATFESASVRDVSATFDSSNNKVVIAYKDAENNNFGTAVVATVSGTSIDYGPRIVFSPIATIYISATFDSLNNKVVIAYEDDGNTDQVTVVAGTVSGSSISFGQASVIENSSTSSISATFDSSNNKVAIAYRDNDNLGYGTSAVFQNVNSNLTLENFIGISNDSYADGESATIQVVGAVDDAQTGLTAGQSLFVKPDGTLSETLLEGSVFAGTALSSTNLLIKG